MIRNWLYFSLKAKFYFSLEHFYAENFSRPDEWCIAICPLVSVTRLDEPDGAVFLNLDVQNRINRITVVLISSKSDLVIEFGLN